MTTSLLAACGAAAPSTSPSAAGSAATPAFAAAAPSGSAAAKPSGASPAASKPAGPAASAAAKPAASGTTAVKVGATWTSFTQMPFFYAIERGYLAKQGLSLEQVTIPLSEQTIAPLTQNQIQVGAAGFGVSLYNAVSRDISLYMTADNGSATGTSSAAIVVRKALADQIKDYKDLKGRKVALSSKGTSIQVTLAKALQAGGLTFNDIDVVSIGFSDMVPALANGAVDVALLTEPAIAQGVANGTLSVFKWTDEVYPNQQFNAVLYSPQFAKTPAAQGFMTAYLQGVRDYNDVIRGKGSMDDFARIGAKYLPVKDPALYKAVHQIGIDPNGKLQLGPMQQDIDFYISQGLMKDKPDLSKLVDNSFADNAVKELGPYK
ncbi:MAG TPA: ABC transporter substrate-binding protein [Chloroflexota bacterium]|nr:ABC transporter substrate-binding protein [Chloroflexota bacterium]